MPIFSIWAGCGGKGFRKMHRAIRETKKVVEMELPSEDLICKKCFEKIGSIFDETYLEIGETRFWNPTSGTHKCHKSFYWRPRVDDIDGRDGFDDSTRQLLIGLGK